MALIVEDGTGLADAESYISVADADVYATAYIVGATLTAWNAASVTEQENALRRATAYLDDSYGGAWKGRRGSSDQALDWPRAGVADRDGYAVASDAVPLTLANAAVEVAVTNAAGTAPLTPENTTLPGIKREMVKVDVIEEETEYLGGKTTTQSASSRFPKVRRMLADLINSARRTVLG